MRVYSRPLTALLLAVAGALALASTAAGSNYIVLYKQENVASEVGARIGDAGGSVVASYPQIGVVIARSNSESFRGELLRPTAATSTRSPPAPTNSATPGHPMGRRSRPRLAHANGRDPQRRRHRPHAVRPSGIQFVPAWQPQPADEDD